MKKQIFTIILLLMGGVSTFGQFKLDGGINSLRLQTNGLDRLYIAPNTAIAPVLPGNVGIGTINPSAKLTVVGDFALRKIQRETSSGGFNDYDRQDASIAIFENGGTLGGVAGGSEGQMLYVVSGYGNAQSALVIRHDSPSNPTASNRILTHTGADFTISSGLGGVLLIYDATKARWRIVETPNGSGSVAGWGLTGNSGTNPATQFIGTTDAQPLVFRTNNVERMRILSGGNVGIGTSTPATNVKFHLDNGNSGVTPNSGGTFSPTLFMERNGHNYLEISSPDANERGLVFSNPTDGASGGIYYNAKRMSFRTGSNDTRMTINDVGNIGIGTTTPNATLDIYGNVILSKKIFFSGATGTVNDLNTSGASLISYGTSSNVSLTGIAGGIEGQILILTVSSNSTVILKHDDNSSFLTNKIVCNTGADITITGGNAILLYNGGRWGILSVAP